MKRIAIITVGKTHSGKTIFARALEKQLESTVVIEQDNHAEFLNCHYKILIPRQGRNIIKQNITQKIVNYAITHTNLNIIFGNSNRSRESRMSLLSMLDNTRFYSIVIYFNIPDKVLEARVNNSTRSRNVLRKSSSFEELLAKQQIQDRELEDMNAPQHDEADCLLEISNNEEAQFAIEKIMELAKTLD